MVMETCCLLNCVSVPPQVTASQLSPSSSHKPSILILADSDQERNKWVGLLNELHRILKKNKLKERFVYVPKEAYDSTLPLIKTTQSAAIIGGGLPGRVPDRSQIESPCLCGFTAASLSLFLHQSPQN